MLKRKKYAKDEKGFKVEVEVLPPSWTYDDEQEKRKEELLKDYYRKKRDNERKNFGVDILYALTSSITKLGLLFFFTWLILFIYAGFAYFVWNVVLHNITGLAVISFSGSYGFCLLLTALGSNIKKQVKNLRPSSEFGYLNTAQEYEKMLMDIIFNIFVYLGFGPLGFSIFWDKFLHEFAEIEKPGYFIVVIGFFIIKSIYNQIKYPKKEAK